VTRQVAKCKCPKRFQVEQIGANKYRVSDVFFMFWRWVKKKLYIYETWFSMDP